MNAPHRTIRFPIYDPTFYWSQGDEDRFFGCIYALPEFLEVKWDGSALQLTLTKPISGKSFRELYALFRRYRVPVRPLQPLFSALPKRAKMRYGITDEFWANQLSEDDQLSDPRHVSSDG